MNTATRIAQNALREVGRGDLADALVDAPKEGYVSMSFGFSREDYELADKAVLLGMAAAGVTVHSCSECDWVAYSTGGKRPVCTHLEPSHA